MEELNPQRYTLISQVEQIAHEKHIRLAYVAGRVTLHPGAGSSITFEWNGIEDITDTLAWLQVQPAYPAPGQEATLEAFAQEVMRRHCWALGGVPCTLTSEQGSYLMDLGIELAEQRGYDNGGTGALGMHPTQGIPRASYELYLPARHQHYSVVMLVTWEPFSARFDSLHICGTWRAGCERCKALRGQDTPEG